LPKTPFCCNDVDFMHTDMLMCAVDIAIISPMDGISLSHAVQIVDRIIAQLIREYVYKQT
jgi:hypothetical protein